MELSFLCPPLHVKDNKAKVDWKCSSKTFQKCLHQNVIACYMFKSCDALITPLTSTVEPLGCFNAKGSVIIKHFCVVPNKNNYCYNLLLSEFLFNFSFEDEYVWMGPACNISTSPYSSHLIGTGTPTQHSTTLSVQWWMSRPQCNWRAANTTLLNICYGIQNLNVWHSFW